MKRKAKSTSFYMSVKALKLLKAIAENFGISKSAVLELLIREKAKKEKIK